MKKLVNHTPRMVTINLAHDVVCADKCLCSAAVHRAVELNPKTGETGVREIQQRICASIHLLPKATSDELPDSVTQLPAVRAALAARPRRISVIDVPSVPASE